MLNIRPATAEDVPLILEFVRELAVYEREPHAVEATEADFLRDGFGPNPYFHCLMGEVDGQPAGFALYFFNYSTWTGHPGIYLEDLFVRPEFRGCGLGKALLAQVASIAVEKDCRRMQWSVLDWNQPAIDFYLSLGGKFMDEWRGVRLTGESLVKVAALAEVTSK
jgi:GNAT superfamily N-acetyltransferase